MNQMKFKSKLAKKLVDYYGFEEPSDIDIEDIAFEHGATIKRKPLSKYEASIVGTDKKAIITVNSKSRKQRQNFSIAHELHHLLVDKGRVSPCQNDELSNKWSGPGREPRANRFAAEILMPPNILRNYIPEKLSKTSVYQVARAFNTSIIATSIRLVELFPVPSMLCCYNSGRRKWYFGNEHVPKKFVPNLLIQEGTMASGLKRGKTVETPKEVDANLWFDVKGSFHYMVTEFSFTGHGKDILVYLTWHNESQIVDFLEWEDREYF